MGNSFNNTGLFITLNKWRWHLLVVIMLAFILSIIISSPLITPPRFRSFAVLYPAYLTPYSEESQTEQMLQWFNSRDIMDSVIIKFDLAEHYGIDHTDVHFYSRMQKLFNRNVRIERTRFESVVLEVRDRDPLIARDMVYSIIDFYNKKVNLAHREKYLEVMQLEEKRMSEKKQQLDSLKTLMLRLRKTYDLIDYGIQANEATKGLMGTFDGGNMAQVNVDEVKRTRENIKAKGDSLLLLTNLMTSATSAYTNYLISYEQAVLNVNKELTFATIVTHPVVADRKYYPIRWIIVFNSVFFTALLAIILILIMERIKKKE